MNMITVTKYNKKTGKVWRCHDEGAYQAKGWLTLRAMGHGTHFQGYVNDKLITHGHARELPPAPVGFFIQGRGRILLKDISVISLREN